MTITEIAKAAGVSTATVSRFLNNGPVKEETRKKLEESILKLNYVPESFAHKIVNTSAQGAVIVITHSLSNPYSTEFMEAVVNRYQQERKVCYTACCANVENEYRYLMDVITRNVSGVIMHDPIDGRGQEELYNRISQRIPLIVIHSFPADIECNTITVNQEKGMRDAMAYLTGMGHRRIAYIRGEDGYSFAIKERVWREELARLGAKPQPQDAIKVRDTDTEAGGGNAYREVLAYLRAGNRPTAIFSANDIIASGVLAALREEGLSCPQDISVMSHDNTIVAREHGLTCVDMKIRSVALAAVDLMDYAISGADSTPRHISISPAIVERGSCRALEG